MTKNQVIQTVNKFPKEFELEQLLEKLIFIEKVENGLQQVKEGKTISHEQVKIHWENGKNKVE